VRGKPETAVRGILLLLVSLNSLLTTVLAADLPFRLGWAVIAVCVLGVAIEQLFRHFKPERQKY